MEDTAVPQIPLATFVNQALGSYSSRGAQFGTRGICFPLRFLSTSQAGGLSEDVDNK